MITDVMEFDKLGGHKTNLKQSAIWALREKEAKILKAAKI